MDPIKLGKILNEVEHDLRWRIAKQHYDLVDQIKKQLPDDLRKISTHYKDPSKMSDVIVMPGGDWVSVELERRVDHDRGRIAFQSIVTYCFEGEALRRGGGKPFYVEF